MNTLISTTNGRPKSDKHDMSTQETQSSQDLQMTYSPRFDIWEGEQEFVLYGELPGVSPDDLCIEFEKKQLTVYGRVARQYDGTKFLVTEYGIGNFRRSFMIGEAVDIEAIHAELRNGLLTVHLPKAEEAKPRKIEIKVN